MQFSPTQTKPLRKAADGPSSLRACDSIVVKPPISMPETVHAIDDCPPLLRLPSEIRREILKYLIPSSTKIFRLWTGCDSAAAGTKSSRHLRPHPDKVSLSILRTNRILYYEALAMLYSENLFHFIGFNYLAVLDFIRRLSPEAKALMRRVRLTILSTLPGQQPTNHDTFCAVVHDFLPGLNALRADPSVFF